MTKRPFILGLGGTARVGSSSERALMLSLRSAESEGARVEMLSGSDIDLPMYVPGSAERCGKAQRLIKLFRACDGLVVSSPAYHGSVSGLLKNALDYTEDLSTDARVYLDGCAAGLIACGAGWQGAASTLTALRAIAHTLRAWPTPMGAMLNTTTRIFDESGACIDRPTRFQLETVGSQVAQFALMKRASAAPAELAEV